VLADPNIHQLGLLYATVLGRTLELGASVLAEAAARSDKPVLAFSVMPPELAGIGCEILRKARIPVRPSPARVARAMGMLADYSEALAQRDRSDAMTALSDLPADQLPPGAGTLDERESKAFAALCGIPVTRDAFFSPGQAVVGLRFPLAVKAVSRDIAHKTDIGAVRLGICDAAALAAAAREVLANARKARPDARLSGVLACEMIDDGLETIVGVVNDPVFGPVVALGLGGVFTESMRDVTFRIAPFGIDTARRMIGELRAAALFEGVRGQPPRDVDALAATLARVSTMAWLLRDRIAEIDLNPLFVRPRGCGVVAADALIVLR
jgi:acetyltransferase